MVSKWREKNNMAESNNVGSNRKKNVVGLDKSELKKQRLGAALRENLKRRKLQAQGRIKINKPDNK